MKRFFTLLVCWAMHVAPVRADVVIYHATGETVVLRFDDVDDTEVTMTEGSVDKLGRYVATDANLVTASLDAGTYSARAYIGTIANTVAVVPTFNWSGTVELPPDANTVQVEGADATDTLATAAETGADAALVTYDGPTNTEATADKEEILGMMREKSGAVTAVIDSVTSASQFVVTITGSAVDGAFDSWMVIVRDLSDSSVPPYAEQRWVVAGSNGFGTTYSLTLNSALSFTPAVGDIVELYPTLGFVSNSGTVVDATSQTITLESAASSVDSFYNSQVVRIVGGVGIGQSRIITQYVGATRVVTVKPSWVTTPDVQSTYAIVPGHQSALVDDAITAAKFDESTAFPVTSADTSTTRIARTGADSDTLETISDQADVVTADTNELQTDWADGGRLDLLVDSILADTADIQPKIANTYTGWELDGAVYRLTTNALEQGPTGSGASAETIADAVWDELLAGHVTAETFGGAFFGAEEYEVPPTPTQVRQEMDSNSTQLAKLGTPSNLGTGANLAANAADLAGTDFVSATHSLKAQGDNILEIQSGSSADPTFPDKADVWVFNSATRLTANNTIVETTEFDALLGLNLDGVLDKHLTVAAVISVTISGTPATKPVLGTATITTDYKQINIPCDCTAADTGDFVVTVTYRSSDNQVKSRKGNLTIQ
jgi:hypothetical protein